MLTPEQVVWPELAMGDVHVRNVRLNQPRPVCAALEALLSADERARAARFVFERDRRSFVVCRGALRALLGEYVGVAPTSLQFSYGTHGKPVLASDPSIAFNVSHAGEIGVFAFTRTGPVGVDVESADRVVSFDELAHRFFTVDEARELAALPAGLRAQGFFNCWTRKEAFIKALGDGLSCPLDSFAVSLRPGQPCTFKWIVGDDATRWSLTAFAPAPRYVAALAMPWHGRVDIRRWEPNGTAAAVTARSLRNRPCQTR